MRVGWLYIGKKQGIASEKEGITFQCQIPEIPILAN
jgi:hypothetical protein